MSPSTRKHARNPCLSVTKTLNLFIEFSSKPHLWISCNVGNSKKLDNSAQNVLTVVRWFWIRSGLYESTFFQSWKEAGVEFLQLATTDIFATPCQKKLVEGVTFINKFIRRDNIINGISTSSVYIHCKAGRTRSATLVGCYLIHVSMK